MNATKLCAALAYLLLFIIWAWAQGKTITGTIIDQHGLPLPRNIVVENTANITQSDSKGNFTIGSGIGKALHKIIIKDVPYFFIHQLMHSGIVPGHYYTVFHNKVLKG